RTVIKSFTSGTMQLSAPLCFAIGAMSAVSSRIDAQRARARDLGVKPGVFAPGALNAITDVAGVRVGQTTVIEGDSVRTGITAILPHGGNLSNDRVPAALHVGNGFGKITGVTQLKELGELETPIRLTCTLCGWKGGIGTSSRVLPVSLGGWTVGVLVQTNFGGILQVLGAPVGKELGQYAFQRQAQSPSDRGDGSCVMIVATDAPLSDRNLERLAARAIMGLARTGSSAANGSGDYALAFSTSDKVRRASNATRLTTEELANEQMSGLFEAAVEATEEAI